MERKLVNLINSSGAESMVSSENNKMIALPFLVDSLLVCNDLQVEQGIKELLSNIKNLELTCEKKVTFVTHEYQLAIIVYSGDEQQSHNDIEKIANTSANILLVGDNLPPQLLRKSLKHAIKDFIPLKTVEEELLPTIETLVSTLSVNIDLAPVITVINGKGGSGASFITNLLGQVISKHSAKQVVVIDGDLQHGTLADSMACEPDYYLDDAINDVKELDATAIKSMMSCRGSVSLLPVKPYSKLNHLSNLDNSSVSQLMSKVRANFDLCIADLSTGLDSFSIPLVEMSEQIFIVIQQNIVSIREAKALIEQLKLNMGTDPNKIHILVNRFSSKHSTISLADVTNTLGVKSAFKVTNDYQVASACTDLAKTINDLPESKEIEKELITVINSIMSIDLQLSNKPKSLWAKITGKS
ncbi:AAA family ATPase [Thalassotalea crassostreae]|uniref:AAA family ATPase n=1 Tax=Thalassotalea crassostreae TaxID=1763536 RepID=UPI0009ED1998|nr:AAA family ATPase [Thalassotalea crassostreae]